MSNKNTIKRIIIHHKTVAARIAWQEWCRKNIKRIYPQLISHEICGVQPMECPLGLSIILKQYGYTPCPENYVYETPKWGKFDISSLYDID